MQDMKGPNKIAYATNLTKQKGQCGVDSVIFKLDLKCHVSVVDTPNTISIKLLS